MTTDMPPTDALRSDALMEALSAIYPVHSHPETGMPENPHPYTRVAAPRNKLAMEQAVAAVATLLSQCVQDIRDMPHQENPLNPEADDFVRTILHNALHQADHPKNVDPTITALKNADDPAIPQEEYENPRAAELHRNNRIQTVLVAAQRTLENLRVHTTTHLWNATTAMERAVTATAPGIGLVEGQRTPRFSCVTLTNRINSLLHQEQENLQTLWHRHEA